MGGENAGINSIWQGKGGKTPDKNSSFRRKKAGKPKKKKGFWTGFFPPSLKKIPFSVQDADKVFEGVEGDRGIGVK